ncbi:pilin N-terminal domain-containing protein [Enterococcus mundtii]|nr:pilin N-terminal domain-containing protein [Enterococcus mundtii]
MALLPNPQVFAEGMDAQLVIHKKKMLDFPQQEIQNTGKEMTEFNNYQGLADVTFHVYDVTESFAEARKMARRLKKQKRSSNHRLLAQLFFLVPQTLRGIFL